MPVTLPYEYEHPQILDLLYRHTRPGRNQQTTLRYSSSIDFESAMEEWNSLCMQEFSKPTKDIPEDSLATKDVPFEAPAGAESATHYEADCDEAKPRFWWGTIIGCAKAGFARSTTSQSTNEEAVSVQTGAPATACLKVAPITGEPVVVPPSELNNDVRNIQIVMGGLARQERFSLLITAPQKVTPAKHRCMRCGNEKSGEYHQSGSTSSESYCTVPRNMSHPHWPVLKGYQIGDLVSRRMTARKIKILWNKMKREKGISDTASFRGW